MSFSSSVRLPAGRFGFCFLPFFFFRKKRLNSMESPADSFRWSPWCERSDQSANMPPAAAAHSWHMTHKRLICCCRAGLTPPPSWTHNTHLIKSHLLESHSGNATRNLAQWMKWPHPGTFTFTVATALFLDQLTTGWLINQPRASLLKLRGWLIAAR